MTPRDAAARIESLVSEHDRWREQCLNLNPAESAMSRRSRAVLSSDMATRLTEGFPGCKLYPHGDQNKYAALAISLAETMEFGKELASRMVENAQALGSELTKEGIEVLAKERGFTQSHQIFLNLGAAAQHFELACQAANILLSDCALTGDAALARRSGARLATHEITRLGMGKREMGQIARLMGRAWRGEGNSGELASSVRALLDRFSTMHYSFDADE
jgi:glycine/serine hydroxymethyltransferase